MTTVVSIILLFALFYSSNCNKFSYKFYPNYHVAPLISKQTEVGWMNDPNGFLFFQNDYHLFYQYNPYNSTDPGIAHWGHAKSKDLISWEHLDIALYPDKPYDKDGVFSGSGIVVNDTMYLFYTGNVNHDGQSPDHEQHQHLATSNDGITFEKYDVNPIINGTDRQPNFRDPFVWKHNGTYYMVLGNSFNDENNRTLGQVLLYNSTDLIDWNEVSVLGKSEGKLGYMWECPAFFKLGEYYVLLMSPQGVEAEEGILVDKYKNLYATGYIVGDFDYNTYLFTPLYSFRELDHGHDFYATQTMITPEGDRVNFAWMDMWESDHPEGPDGFTGMLTLPRTLEMTCDGRLLQKPYKNIAQAVGKKLYADKACAGQKVQLEYNAAKVEVQASSQKNFTLVIESDSANDTVLITYDAEEGRLILDRGGKDGVRRTTYKATSTLCFTVYIDSSSAELFTCDGYVTMSSRFFPFGTVSVSVGSDSYATLLSVNSLERTIASPNTYV